jgi:hypothetical protein
VIATAAHVIHGARTATVRFPIGETFEVQGIVVIDELRDFALLRIAGYGLPTVALGNSDSVDVGRRLLAFGAPLGFEASVADGLLSSIRLDQGTRLFQVSVPVSPGSSGGPVTTEDGRVIGLVVSGIQGGGAQNLNFALPINYLRGQIGLASTKVPTPLAQVTYGPSGGAGHGERGMQEATAADLPSRVNDSLGVDWRFLDGVELRSESRGDKGIRYDNLAAYVLSRTAQGEPTLERITTEVLRQTQDILSGRDALTWYQDNTRTVLRLGTAPKIEYHWRRTASNNSFVDGSLTLQIDGGQVVLDSAGSRRGWPVPSGALPDVLLGAVVASLPDPLPRSVYIWLFDPSKRPMLAEPVRVDFGAPAEMRIPLAREGTHCSLTPLTEHTKATTVPVVEMTVTLGPDRLNWPVLARRPHVNMQDAKCVRLPL